MKMDSDRLERSVRTALIRSVADREIPDEVVSSVAGKLGELSSVARMLRYKICPYGICLDYEFEPAEWPRVIERIFALDYPVKKFRGFPMGILVDDLIRFTVEVELEELAYFVKPPMEELGFGD